MASNPQMPVAPGSGQQNMNQMAQFPPMHFQIPYQLMGMNPMAGMMPQKIRILVSLRKEYTSNEIYKKLMVVMNGTDLIASLKRAIEKEFMELFPNENPFVVAKLEDADGYSLSNSSAVQDFISNG